jgi:Bacterial Ig domain/Neocarzinostatin family
MTERTGHHRVLGILGSALLVTAAAWVMMPVQSAVADGPARLVVDVTPGGSDLIELSGWPPEATVVVGIDGAVMPTDPIAVQVDALGNAHASFPDGTIGLGSIVTADDGATTKQAAVVDLRPELLDSATDTVAGTAPAGATVVVSVWPGGGGPPVAQAVAIAIADALGQWTVGLAPHDLLEHDIVQLRMADVDGDELSYTAEVRRPWIFASLNYAVPGTGGPPDWFWVNGWIPGTSLHAEVDFEDDGTIDWTVDRVVMLNMPGFELATSGRLTAGSRVRVEGGGWTKELVLVALRAEYLDATTDVVAGAAPAGETVTVGVSPPVGGPLEAEAALVADLTGWWRYDLGDVGYDLVTGRTVSSSIADDDGDITGDGQTVSRPTISVHVARGGPPGYVSLSGWPDGTPLSVTVDYDGDGTVDDTYPWVAHRFGPGIIIPADRGPLRVGSIVTAIADHGVAPDRWRKVATVVDVGIEYLNHVTDIAAGVGPPGAVLTVSVWPPAGGPPIATAGVVADSTGWWRHDFAADSVELPIGRTVDVKYIDDDDDSVGGAAQVHTPTVGAMIGAGPGWQLMLTDWYFGVPFTITVDYDDDGVVDTMFTSVDPMCNCRNIPPSGGALQVGTVITLTADHGVAPDRWQKVLVVEPLSVGSVDAATDVVSGTAPAGRTVTVSILWNVQMPPPSMTALVAADGTWTADFTGTHDIVAGQGATVRLPDDDGDTTGAGANPGPSALWLDVTPSTDLTDGQVVRVTGGNWPVGPGFTMAVTQCLMNVPLGVAACDGTTTTTLPVSPTGTVDGDMVVRRTITTGYGVYDCGVEPCGLVAVVWGTTPPGGGAPAGLDAPGNNRLYFLLDAPPTAVDDTATAIEGMGPVEVPVLANDIDPDDELTIVGWTQGVAGGGVSCTATACAYTPPLDGLLSSDSFTYTISDGTTMATATVVVTLHPNASVVEGRKGTTTMRFTVVLVNRVVAGLPAVVLWRTEAGTAQLKRDYVEQSGAMVFPSGVSTRILEVKVVGDRLHEPDEHLFVRLTGLNAALADARLTGVIVDDDPLTR